MVQYLYKNWLLVSKSHKESGQLHARSGKFKKLTFDGLLLSRNIFLQLKYILLTTWWTFTKFLKSFLKLLVIFHDIFRLYFVVQVLQTLDKNSPWKCKFSDFPLLELKFTKFLVLFFSNKKSVFLQSLDQSSVSWEITFLYFFSSNSICYWKSSTSKCKFSDLLLLALKFTKFLMLFLKPKVSFFSNFALLFSVMRDNSSVIFHL